ncbi:hypothetical protein [Pedobacter agri]|uniref:Alpha/beta hydrolase n=1 Tax=Pedobacter agri TaxID=454586 RepID=A0A9X3DDV8_9SPHI|nr:hypothetical protein [Pedobacter agri]MCX3265492.1 hypothetical protein [Pedobacter agri]
MKKLLIIPICIIITAIACKKDKTPNEEKEVIKGNIKQVTETVNGITYKIFTGINTTNFKGTLVVGSGNDENNPSEGAIDGAAETALCEKAASNGYAAAIVKYQKPAAGADWNSRAKLMGEDFNKAIVGISGKYGIDKNKSVVAGFSYTSFMLFTDISLNPTLSYTKGLLGACGATGTWNAQNFKIPIFAINCSGNNEGNFNGKALYDQIPANSPIKAKSEGVTDNSCNSHCGGDWTDKMYTKMVAWLQ